MGLDSPTISRVVCARSPRQTTATNGGVIVSTLQYDTIVPRHYNHDYSITSYYDHYHNHGKSLQTMSIGEQQLQQRELHQPGSHRQLHLAAILAQGCPCLEKISRDVRALRTQTSIHSTRLKDNW